MRISEGICFPLLLYLSLLITCKHEEEQANGKVTESGAYLVKLVFPFAFPPQRGRFLKGYVPPPRSTVFSSYAHLQSWRRTSYWGHISFA
jgi:hypothetical protein